MKLAIPYALHIKQAYFFVLLLICAGNIEIQAQSYDRLDIPLVKNGQDITDPWVGGLIAPQFNAIDLDGDGLLDLLVFDRLGNVLLPYLNTGGSGETKYTFAPEYKEDFPKVENWIKVRDYNADGIPDLFSYPVGVGIAGIEVHRGTRENGKLSFEKLSSSLGQSDILYFRIGSNVTQVYVSSIDLPEIADLDGDGDLDIIAFDPSGGQVSFYKNVAVEKNLGLDTLVYELEDVCYGKFIESGFSEDVVLSGDGNRCGGSLRQEVVEIRHAGSTITAFDENGDGLIDIFLGDLTYNGIVALTNGGSQSDAWFSSSIVGFPTYDEPVEIEVFNALFYMDVDNDGLKDLIAAPNEEKAIQNNNHIWMYKNQGTNDEPDFDLNDKQFLIGDMLHFGTASSPTFTDVDQDGLLDIVVGTSGFRVDNSLRSRLYYLRNVGTYNVPKFVVEDEDYLGFSQFSDTSLDLAPTFGDLDGDGDQDLLIGDDRGFLYYLENEAGAGNAYRFKTPIYEYQDIKVGTYAKPFIIDVDQDELPDLVVGERNFNSVDGVIGSLNYLRNTGSSAAPKFEEITSEVFGGVSTKDINFINNYSSPYFYLNGDKLQLFTGSENGRVYLYDGISGEVNSEFNLVNDNLGNIREGIRTSPAVADINNDGVLDVLVGNRRGGLAIYSSDIANETVAIIDEAGKEIVITISPNPVINELKIELEADQIFEYTIVDVSGIAINKGYLRKTKNIDTTNLPSGSYFVKIKNERSSTTLKFIKT